MPSHDHTGLIKIRGVCPVCKSVFNMETRFCLEVPRNYIVEQALGQALCFTQQHLEKDHGVRMVAQMHDRPVRVPVQEVWTSWADCTSCGATTVNTVSGDAWQIWCSGDSSTATSSTVWVVWAADGTRYYYGVDYGSGHSPGEEFRRQYVMGDWNVQVPKETPAQRAAREEREARQRAEDERRREEQRRRDEERRKKEAAVEATARELLREVLTEEQNKELDEKQHFTLQVVGGSRYRIKKGSAYNVEKLDAEGRAVEKLCFGPPGLPAHDVMVCQKLMLEADEEGTRKLANISRY